MQIDICLWLPLCLLLILPLLPFITLFIFHKFLSILKDFLLILLIASFLILLSLCHLSQLYSTYFFSITILFSFNYSF